MDQPRVSVAMLGARMHYAVPRLLHEAGLLERFFTDSYVGNKPLLEAVLRAIPGRFQARGVQRWLGRKDAILPPGKVKSFELLGVRNVLARSLTRNERERREVLRDFSSRFSDCVLREGLGDASIVWGFNGASVDIFEEAKARGKRCILEQTILPKVLETALLKEEHERWPQWQSDCPVSEEDPVDAEREVREWNLADRIVTGSEFARDGLIECGVPTEKIRVVPYGVDLARFPLAPEGSTYENRPLRVLFAGEVGLRKGAPYLLQALERLGPERVQARFAGEVNLCQSKMEPFSQVAEFLGPVPRLRMSSLFQWADILVLPSIAEGSATVVYEALSSGLPVITTKNSGSIVQDGVNGRIVPLRSVDGLVEAIGMYVNDHSLFECQRMGAKLTRSYASLERYGDDIKKVVCELFE